MNQNQTNPEVRFGVLFYIKIVNSIIVALISFDFICAKLTNNEKNIFCNCCDIPFDRLF